MSLKAIEKPFITETLQRRNGNRKLAAEDLGLSVSTLYRKINAYGIAPRCRRSGAAKRIGHYDRFGCFPKQIDPVPATV